MVVLRETGRLTLRLTIAMSALAILAVVIRLIARNKAKWTFQSDDTFILLGLTFFLGVEACLLAGAFYLHGTTGMKQYKG